MDMIPVFQVITQALLLVNVFLTIDTMLENNKIKVLIEKHCEQAAAIRKIVTSLKARLNQIQKEAENASEFNND